MKFFLQGNEDKYDVTPSRTSSRDSKHLRAGACVGELDGISVGEAVALDVGRCVGDLVGAMLGEVVGELVAGGVATGVGVVASGGGAAVGEYVRLINSVVL